MTKAGTPTILSLETLPQARARTEAASTFLGQKLQVYVDVLRPLMAPQRGLGTFCRWEGRGWTCRTIV